MTPRMMFSIALLLALAALLLAGCATPRVVTETKIVEVKVPTPVGCPDPKDIPARPGALHDEHPVMPKDADSIARLALAKVAEWIGYGQKADGVMQACAKAGK